MKIINIKRDQYKLIAVLAVWLSCQTVKAQYDAILGDSQTSFTFFVNNEDMTCEIRDEHHTIDDRPYAYIKGERKLKGFKHISGTRTFVVPEKVKIRGLEYTITAIGRAAFAGYSNIDYIILPETVTRIGDYAFFRSSIHRITIPSSVREVGKRVFGYCEKLVSITTMMGGVNITKECYAESQNCKLTFKNSEEYAKDNERQQFYQKSPNLTVKPHKRIESDVDSDIPVAAKQNENFFALIIANENYQSVLPVEYAIHDGEVFKQYCQTVLGLPEYNITLLKNATLLNMRHEVEHLKQVADAYGGTASFIFYYSGHGFPNDKGTESYLLPIDATRSDPKQGYALKELYSQFGEMNASKVVAFMDACFSGSNHGEGMLSSVRGVARKVPKEKLSGNMVVFSAASNDETANPCHEQGHGLFTYFLLKKLKSSPKTTLGELSSYINQEVRKYSNVRIRKEQNPETTCSMNIENTWQNWVLK